MVKFDDDISILHHFRDTAEDKSQAEWSHLEDWSRDVGLCLNYDKCNVMNCITKSSLVLDPIVCDNGASLKSVSSLRLLGVLFSSNMTWNEHISHITAKCFRRFFILRNLKRANCSHHLLLKCYLSFIRSLLLYGFPCFCNLPKYLFAKLLRVERLAGSFFSDVNFAPLSAAADAMCKKMFYQISKNTYHPLRLMFDERLPTPRNSSTLRPPRSFTKRFSHSFIRYGKC